jgi:HK97 family phage major capsid protein/HK97 family phage prohead protease
MHAGVIDREKILGKPQARTLAIERGAVDEEKRTVNMAFSSEEPYARWWGIETLDHGRESIRLGRVQDGAPCLVGHNTDDQVGVIEHVELGADRKLRATVRFGRSDRANEIFNDVKDGIRRKVSVGYIIHDLVLEKQEDDTNSYRVTDWEPLEVSVVAVPVDNSVGIGRKLAADTQKGNAAMNESENNGVQTSASGQAGTPTKAEIASALRFKGLMAAGAEFRQHGGEDLARDMIASGDGDIEIFKARMLERMRGTSRPFATAQAADVHYGEGARASFPHGKLRSFQDTRMPDGRIMPAQEAAHRSGMWLKAIYGNKQAAQWCSQNGLSTRAMGENTLGGGGALVPIEMANAFIYLVEQYGVFRRNARHWPMGSDQLKIARRKTGLSVFLVGENDAATESTQGWDNVTLSTKKAATLVRVSNELIEDSAIAVADALNLDIALAFATQEDQNGFIGDGTSTYFGMTGLTKILVDGNHGASLVAAASTHKTWATLDNTDLVNLMSALPLFARRNAKFYCSTVAWDRCFSRLMAVAGGNRVGSLDQKPQQAYLGYPVEFAQAMPAGATTDYSTKCMILFGDLSMSSAFGDRRMLTVRASTDRYLENDQTAFMCTERFDIVNHSCGDNTNAGPIVGLQGTA